MPTRPATSTDAALQEARDRIRARAARLAGEPDSIPQRAVFLAAIYRDSKGRAQFPLIALHGALWAHHYFEETGPIAKAIGVRYFYDREEQASRMAMLEAFRTGLARVNRQVFIDTYSNYWFTKELGRAAGAEELVSPELLAALNRIHEAARTDEALPPTEQRALFHTCLLWEQENTVAEQVKQVVRDFACPILRALLLKPLVQFSYFPRTEVFLFRDFAEKEERIERAMRSYDLAAEAGFPEVEAAMKDYGVLPDAYFEDRDGYARALEEKLLA